MRIDEDSKINQFFSDSEIINILNDNNQSAEIIITTSKSCYKGCIYKAFKESWYSNKIRINRNNRFVCYQPESFRLTEKTYKIFKNLKAESFVDFFKKKLNKDDIVFNDGRLYRIILIVNDTIYLHLVAQSNYYEEWDEIEYRLHGEKTFKLDSEEISCFVKIDNPLDLLTI